MIEERITSRQNPALQHVKKLLSSRAYRNSCGEFAADGLKLLREATQCGCLLKTVVLCDGVEVEKLPEGVRLLRVSRELMQFVSNMQAPQGALFTARIPPAPKCIIQRGTLILDGIQDPGNLGTILRTADALGVNIVLSEGCADAYNEKTVRAAMGAVFRMQIQTATREEILRQCEQIPLAVTALHKKAKDIRQTRLSDYAVVIGSEGKGVCEDFLEQAALYAQIPMNPRCESLNASIAAAIIMWQMQMERE